MKTLLRTLRFWRVKTKDTPMQTHQHCALQSLCSLFYLATFCALGVFSTTTYSRTYAPSSAEPALEALLRVQEKRLSQESSQLELKSGLFHYWQGQHLEGLKLAAKNPDQGSASTDSIMLGQMMVAWGLFDDAEKILKIALAQASPSDANIIWMHLAQEIFEAGSIPQALAVIERNVRKPSHLIEGETNLLKALQLIEEGKVKQAKRALKSIPSLSSLSPYSLFNAATAYSKIGNTAKATELFDVLMSIPDHSDELRLIRDRATLALGLMFLQQNNGEYAALALEDVRQHSPYLKLALLAKGWAHFNSKEWDEAYSTWHTLATIQSDDITVIEAKASLPTLFIKKHDWANAAHFLNQAQTALDANRAMLQSNYQALATKSWLKHLKAKLEQKSSADSLQLSNTLRVGYQRYQEILELQSTLNHWAETLATLDQWVRQRVVKLNKDRDTVDKLLANLDTNKGVGQNLQAIGGRFKRLNARQTTWTHASDDQTKLKQQLIALREETQALSENNPVRQLLLARVARLEGLLVWDVVKGEDKIVRSGQSNQDDIANRVEQNRDRVIALKKQQQNHLETLFTWQTMFRQTQKRLNHLNTGTQAMKSAQEQHLKNLYIADLDRISKHLASVNQRLALTNATVMEKLWSEKIAAAQ